MNSRALENTLILVVDDIATNRDVLRYGLERFGAGIMVASGGVEALEFLEGDMGRTLDAVLLDYMMPDLDGFSILQRVRETRSAVELPIIMQTARTDSSSMVDCLMAGANDYVTKPIDLSVLVARLVTHLNLRRLSLEKDSFLAMASHDLKTPLATVRGFASLLQTMFPPGQPMTDRGLDLLVRMERQSRSMERLIGDFLDMDAIENGRLKLYLSEVNLETLAREQTESIREMAAAKGIDVGLMVAPSEESWIVRGDGDRLRQVLSNLLGNSVKYCPRDSAVEVRLTGHRLGIQLDVVDTGPGIPSADVERIFDKYTRLLHQATGGEKSSGLGLCIVRWLVELHGGKISVHNNSAGEGPGGADRGATFRVILPREAVTK